MGAESVQKSPGSIARREQRFSPLLEAHPLSKWLSMRFTETPAGAFVQPRAERDPRSRLRRYPRRSSHSSISWWGCALRRVPRRTVRNARNPVL